MKRCKQAMKASVVKSDTSSMERETKCLNYSRLPDQSILNVQGASIIKADFVSKKRSEVIRLIGNWPNICVCGLAEVR